jgi:hypothetical protein
MVGMPCYVQYGTGQYVPYGGSAQPKGKCPELAAAFGTSWRIMPALGSDLISLSLSLLSLQRPPRTESRRTDNGCWCAPVTRFLGLVWSLSLASGLFWPGHFYRGARSFRVLSSPISTLGSALALGCCCCCCVGAIPCLRVRPPTLSRRHLEISTPSSFYYYAFAFNFTSSLIRS